MNTPNKILMQSARETLKGKWGLAIKVTLVYIVIQIFLSFLSKVTNLTPLISFIINAPLALGLTIFWISFSRNNNPNLDQVFEGFESWGRALKAQLLTTIFTLLWTLLLIIPGIIAALSYSQIFYIISEDKNIGINDAIEKSKKMMYGYKWKFFRLQLRFIGWAFLCILTLGIGFLWLIPYIQVTAAKFYDDIKGETPKTPEIIEVPVTN